MRRAALAALFVVAPGISEAQGLDARDIFNFGKAIIQNAPAAGSSQPRQQGRAPATPGAQANSQLVRDIQAGLSRLGYSPGPADGVMGRNTRRAISDFQRDNGLRETGTPSQELLATMNAAAGRPPSPVAVARPSFDCARAGTAIEHAICNSAPLAERDRELASLYKESLASGASPDAIRVRQRAWLQERDACGASQACLTRAMDQRIAELRGGLSGSRIASGVGGGALQPAGVPAQPETADKKLDQVRLGKDGIRVSPEGRLIVPAKVLGRTSPEYRELLVLARILKRAAAREFLDVLAPKEQLGTLAEFARDYLSPEEFRPYLCTEQEMQNDAPDCVSHSDALFAYSMAGGNLPDPAAAAQFSSAFIWWRGDTEFARRRNVSAFLESGLRERIPQGAPNLPVPLLYSVRVRLGAYDFQSEQFPVQVVGGGGAVSVPGSLSSAFSVDEYAKPIPVPKAQAEELMRRLDDLSGDDGAELTLAVAVDLTPTEPHAGQPRWSSKVISSGYFLDRDATRPLTDMALTLGSATAAGQDAPADPTADARLGSTVFRDFNLEREDGRIIADAEGINYGTASAVGDMVDALRRGTSRVSPMPLIFEFLNREQRMTYFGCATSRDCGGIRKLADFAGETEFETERRRAAFMANVPERLIAQAPSMPLPMRLYVDVQLSEYDFEKEGFALNFSRGGAMRLEGGRLSFDLAPLYDQLPDFLKISPDIAERIAQQAKGKAALRVDFDLLSVRIPREQLGTVMTAFRLSGLSLVDQAVHGKVFFDKEIAPTASAPADDIAAEAFLGPETGEAPTPSSRSRFSVLGIAPGMSEQEALDILGAQFGETELRSTDRLIRAEKGLCLYQDGDTPLDSQETGSTCFLARVTGGHIERISLRQVVSTGDVAQMIKEQMSNYGPADVRGDGDAPSNSIGREVFGWGKRLDATRAMLGRADVTMPPHEAELDIIYLNPKMSIVTLRADAPGADAQARHDGTVAMAPKDETADQAAAETDLPSRPAKALSAGVVGIRLGSSLDEAVAQLGTVGAIIYRADVAPASADLVQDRYRLLVLEDGETFSLNVASDARASIIGLARRIPVAENVPIASIRDAFVGTYGAPTFEEKDGGGWTTWRWEASGNTDTKGASCSSHFIDAAGSGTPPKITNETKSVAAIEKVFKGSEVLARRDDRSLFSFLRERAPAVGLSEADVLSGCDAFLEVRVMPSQTHSDQIWIYLVDPKGFLNEIGKARDAIGTKSFKAKL